MLQRASATAMPEFVQIEPVGRCNLACPMCAVTVRSDGPGDDGERLMPFHRFCRIVDEATGLRRLHLQGLGEPLLHPRFFDMVEYAARRGVQVSTNSNLTLLTLARAERCVSSGLAEVSVSIDAADPGVYASIRVGGSLPKVRRNLARLQSARGTNPDARPAVRLVMVLMRRNLDQLVSMVELAAEHRVPALFVQRLSHDLAEPELPARYIPIRSTIDREQLAGAELEHARAVFDRATRTADALGVELRLPRLAARAPTPGGCDWPSTGAYFAWDGSALPCCMVGTPDRGTLSNIDDHPSLSALWHGEAHRRFRDALAGEHPPSVCTACSVYRGTF